jgi:hypothetical protein
LEKFEQQSLFNALSKICWALAAVSLVLVGYTYFAGNNEALPWLTDVTYIKSPLFKEYFTIDGKPMGFSLDQIINWQSYKTGRYRFLEAPQYLLFTLVSICLLVISLTTTYLERFWYMVCAGILVFVSINLGLDQLGLMNEYLAYTFIGLILISTYYFQSFKAEASFTTRLVAIGLILLGFGLLVLFLANGESAAFVIPSYGLLAPIILAGLFVFFVAGDNCFYLFKIATQNAPSGKNALIHFLIIGGIYILLLILLFLDLTGRLSIDLILIDPYTLLLVSVISGYYLMKTKLEVVQSNIPFGLIKRLLYPVLAALTLSLIYYAEITANDSLIAAIKVAIIIPHLAFASVYYIYAFMNFTPDLLSNEVAWPSFFKGEKAPLLTARIATVFFIVGAIYFLEFKPYYQLKAGQYNTLGALAEKQENELLASQYYRQAIFYDYASVKANYSLGMLEKTVGNTAQVIKRFNEASLRATDHKPEMALTQYYSDNGQLFNKLLSLKEMDPSFDDLKVMNSLAIAHYEFGHLDTALYLMRNAYEREGSEIIVGNFLALDLSFSESLAIDSVLESTENFDDVSIKINRQALANNTATSSNIKIDLATDSVLVVEELYYLFNAAIGPPQTNEDLLNAIDYYLPCERNITIKDYLLLAKAIQLYNFGRVNAAFAVLDELMAYDQRKAGLYSYIKSIWAYHQMALSQSIALLAQAESYNFDKTLIRDTYTEFLSQKIDNPAEQLSQHWSDYEKRSSSLSKEEKEKLLSAIASQNAFDVEITLKAVNELRALKLSSDKLYEILQKSIEINPRSISLYEEYIYETVESGLSMIGVSALEELSRFASEADYQRIKFNFEERIGKRQKEALNINQ